MVTFSPNILRYGPILVKKILLQKRVQFHKTFKKLVKSADFEVEKPLEIGPNLQKFLKKKKTNIKSATFWGEKSL